MIKSKNENLKSFQSKNVFEKDWENLTQTEIFYKTIEEDERELRVEKIANKEKETFHPKSHRNNKKSHSLNL